MENISTLWSFADWSGEHVGRGGGSSEAWTFETSSRLVVESADYINTALIAARRVFELPNWKNWGKISYLNLQLNK